MQIGVNMAMGQKYVLYICFIFPFSFFMCNCNQAPWTDVLVLVSNWENVFLRKWVKCKGWGQSVKLGPHSAIWGKLGTALQAYTLNPCTKFPPSPTSRKVNT